MEGLQFKTEKTNDTKEMAGKFNVFVSIVKNYINLPPKEYEQEEK